MTLASTVLTDVAATTSYAAPRRADGVRWSRRVSPEPYSIWMVISELEDGGTIEWDERHGDDGVYVMSGALDVDGAQCAAARCPADGALIVESGVVCTARAVGVTSIVHCGAVDAEPPTDGLYGAPAREGHGVHVIGERGLVRVGES